MNIQVITPYHNTISVLNDTFVSFLRSKKLYHSNHSFSHGECMLYGYAMSQILDKYKIKYELCGYVCKSKQNGHVFFKVIANGEEVYFDSENVYSFCESWKKLSRSYNKVPNNLTTYSSRQEMAKEWNITPTQKKVWDDLVKGFLNLSEFQKICL